MRIPDDVICKVCQGVFCCAECRHKHEIKTHAIIVRKPIIIHTPNGDKKQSENVNDTETIYLFCTICEKRPLALQPELNNEMLLHIELNHLPLRCQKCFKTYNKINDLKEFSKCIHPSVVCQSQETLASNQSCYTDEALKVTVTKAPMSHCMTSQNSPMRRHDFNESHMTPISIINMRWKAKSKLTHEEFISDSVSSIKNISSISNSSIKRSMGVTSEVKGKVIRCSSTPVHLEMVFAKPKEQTFNATGGGHMSSIQYNSSCESDNSFPQPSSQALEPVNRYMKVAGSRPRMSAVTPLRQVMSKSIQKAFAEHGLPASSALGGSNVFQRKKMFDNTSSPEVNDEHSPQQPALDLRLSPAVRRSQSETEKSLQPQKICNQQKQRNDLPNLGRKILLSAQKLTTESIVITHTEHLASVSSSSSATSSNGSIYSVNGGSTNSSYQSARSNSTGGSIFKSCSSVKIITATTEQIQQLQSFDIENIRHTATPPLTPITRIPGAVIHKKLIKFETPKIELCDSCESPNSPNDVFFTPNATPTHKNYENDSAEIKQRKLLVKQNLSGRFSPLRRPSIKKFAHSTAFSRIENITTDFDDVVDGNDDENDEVFLSEEPEKSLQKSSDVKKVNEPQQSSGLWSLMTSVMRLPSRKGSKSKESPKNDSYVLVDASSNSIMKRCASIAGSLIRSKSLVNENEFSSLKRKRTYTTDNQSTSAYLSQLNNSEATSPTSDLNNSTKRFRIHGRRPIDRMRLNS